MSASSTRLFSKRVTTRITTKAFSKTALTKTISQGLLLLTTITAISTLSGCSNATLSDYVNLDAQSAIITDPPGARVIVDDKEVGTTPMKFEGENIYEPHWEGTSYMVKSKLVIKKPGCKEYTRIVKDPIPREIKVKLDCPEGFVATPEPETIKARSYTPASVPVSQPSSIEGRLTQAKKLFDNGLIDKTEYKQLKTKILNDI